MPSTRTSYLKLLLVTAFWGGTFSAGKVATETINPVLAATGRFWFASLFLAAILFGRQRYRVALSRQQIGLLVFASLTGIIGYNLFFFSGLQRIPANRASLIVALNPIMIMTTAAILGMERLTARKLLGIAVALFGAVFVLTDGDPGSIGGSIGTGELLIGGCVLTWSTYTLIGRTLVKTLTPLAATTFACIMGALGLTVAAVLYTESIPPIPFKVWAGVAYLGIFGTGLGFVWYYDGVRTLGPTRAGIFINLVPVWAISLSALLLGEHISWATLVGGAIIMAGVMLTNTGRTGIRPSLSRAARAPVMK